MQGKVIWISKSATWKQEEITERKSSDLIVRHTYLILFFEVFHIGPSGPGKKLFNRPDSVFCIFWNRMLYKEQTMQQFLSIALG